jgi:hypothetical protein
MPRTAISATAVPAITAPLRFLGIWMTALVGTWALTGGFTALVDPYNLVGAPSIEGFNERKYEMAEFGRVGKLHEVKRHQPEAIILGNSQAEGGLRSGTLAHLTGRKSYNLGLLGAPIEETALIFEYAVDVAPIRIAVLALDYVAFEGSNPRTELMRERVTQQFIRRCRDFAELTLSMQAFAAALRNVAFNRLGRLPSHDKGGNWSVHENTPIGDNAAPVAGSSPAESAYIALERIFVLAAAHRVDLRVIATPVHRAFGLDAAARAEWLRRLRTLAAAHGLAIVDEGNDAAFNSDSLNFFDRGHFTPAAGDAFLERLFRDDPRIGARLG